MNISDMNAANNTNNNRCAGQVYGVDSSHECCLQGSQINNRDTSRCWSQQGYTGIYPFKCIYVRIYTFISTHLCLYLCFLAL